ncbi:hypothetical protein VZT92_003259 [Zoarces viviparus]|uniref:Secreted protein n=1 Tax=Zoarces viviparus TaxID=48416 RepID=A0AAW1G300_ZOAVI
MAGLCWMAVTLGLMLSVGNSSAAVTRPNLKQLTTIVKDLLDMYRPSYQVKEGERIHPMFSLAVSIRYDKKNKKYDISQVIKDDPPVKVRNSMESCKVYKGQRVVAATLLKWPNVLYQCPGEAVDRRLVKTTCATNDKTWDDLNKVCPGGVTATGADHAEYRVLQNFDTLQNRNKNDFMLFYVLASPCDAKCTNNDHKSNILKDIKQIQQWKNYAFVFSDVFQPRNVDTKRNGDTKRNALQRLGTSIGLENIFRCKGKRCSSCSNVDTEKVTPFCYTDNNQPGPSPNLPSASNIPPQRGRSDSPSRSGQGERDKKNNKINKSAGVPTGVGRNSGGVVGQGGSGGKTPKKGKGK